MSGRARQHHETWKALGLALGAGMALGPAACTRDPAPRPHVVLITVDTLRADHLGAYGYAAPTSPQIDALAARGVLFRDCTVPWPKTWPSIAALLTGMHPRSSGVRLRSRFLRPSLDVLAEQFSRGGYQTAAVVANFNVGKRFHFHQGFDRFVESWEERFRQQSRSDARFENAPGRVKEFTNGELVTDQALRLLAAREPGIPLFLWLHYIDPHGPYLPPPDYAGLFTDIHEGERVYGWQIPDYQRQTDPVSGETILDLAFYRAQYDREIRYLDDQLGRLFDAIGDLGPAQDTLIVLTADHGESLGEHDYFLEHGRFSYQVNAHVPLVFAQPGRLREGAIALGPVSLVDVPVTLLELAGLPVPDSFEGRSLVPELEGRAPAEAPPVFMESGGDDALSQLTVRLGPWKLIHVRSPLERRTGQAVELYHLGRDPGELRNVAAENPDVVARLETELARWQTLPESDAGPDLDPATLDESSRRMLEGLGYLEE